jgi:hypothetical protein
MAWRVDFTPEAEEWLKQLPAQDRERFTHGVRTLRSLGPTLGRPTVDSVKGSRHSNMKELRVPGHPVRALFAFGPDRRAIVLVGGSKAGREKRWYRQQLKVADRLFTDHLTTFRRESACRDTRAGSRSAGRST